MASLKNKVLHAPLVPPAGLFLLAMAVRLYRIGAESIWLDEATSLFLARKAVPDVIAWTARDIHPPLYYLSLHFWRVFGESEAALRALSALGGALTVVVVYLLGRRLFDRRTGLIAGVLLALAPLHIWYSQQVRMYTWLGFWVLLASYLLLLALEQRKLGLWLAFTTVNALALYTHYYTVFGFLVQGLFALYWSWRNGSWRSLGWTVGSVAGSVALFAPWLPTMAFQVGTGGGGWVAEGGTPTVRALADVLIGFTVGNVRAEYPVWARWLAYLAFGGLVLWAVVSGLRSARDGDRREERGIAFGAIYLVAPIAAAWLISQVKPLYSERYLLAFLPGYVLLVARGVTRLRPKMAVWPVTAVLVGLLSFGAVRLASIAQNPDWRNAAAYVSADVAADDVAVFYPGWDEKPFYYYGDASLPAWTAFKVPLPAEEVAASVDPGLVGHARAWFVWSIGHYGDPHGMLKQYLDDRFTLLDAREFSGGIGARLYQLDSR